MLACNGYVMHVMACNNTLGISLMRPGSLTVTRAESESESSGPPAAATEASESVNLKLFKIGKVQND